MSVINQRIRETDKVFYEENLAPWLPERILDCHVHVCPEWHLGPVSHKRRKEIWAIEAGINQTWEEMRAGYKLLFPNQKVSVLAFGGIYKEHDTNASNEYIASGLSNKSNSAKGLFITRPDWDSDLIIRAMSNGFIGIKPYPDLAVGDSSEISVYDFLPRNHLAAVESMGGIVMLHLPRAGRIADPNNIREILDISSNYPNITFIIAHVGRAFCLPTAEQALPQLVGQPNVYFDTAANLNSDVIQYAIETVGPHRVLFGTDMPITWMRGMREHHGDQYMNYTDGDYSWNTDRKTPEVEAGYTLFIYEGINALIQAAQRSGCGASALRGMLLENGEKLIGHAYKNTQKSRTHDLLHSAS